MELEDSMEDKGPFQNVLVLECEQMQRLVDEIVRSLEELQLGFAGELTISDAMDDLITSLFLDRVPPMWNKLARPTERSLAGWLNDLQLRITQLTDWYGAPMEVPKVTWLAG